MPMVRQEDTDEMLDELLALTEQGATHQAIGGLVTLGKRIGKASSRKAELEKVARAIETLLARNDLVGVTAQEEGDLKAARDACLARAAALQP